MSHELGNKGAHIKYGNRVVIADIDHSIPNLARDIPNGLHILNVIFTAFAHHLNYWKLDQLKVILAQNKEIETWFNQNLHKG